MADDWVSYNCTMRDKIQMVMDLRACESLQGNFSYSEEEPGIGKQHMY